MYYFDFRKLLDKMLIINNNNENNRMTTAKISSKICNKIRIGNIVESFSVPNGRPCIVRIVGQQNTIRITKV